MVITQPKVELFVNAPKVVISAGVTTEPQGPAGGDLSGTYPNPSVVDDSHNHTPGVTIPAYPTALPPSGAAGGDLSGTYPNPAVVNDSHSHTPGVTIPAYPTALPPNGAAGGVLAGSYPNPSLAVDRVRITGDTMSGSLAMGGNKVTGLAASTNNGEAVRHEQLQTESAARVAGDALKVAKAGDTMSGDLAMGNNKVTGLAAASANGEAVRYEQLITATAGINRVIVDLGGWDMDTDQFHSVPHGLTLGNIRGVQVIIRRDDFAQFYDIYSNGGGTINSINSGSITLQRFDSGSFDNTDFDVTVASRGWVLIDYV